MSKKNSNVILEDGFKNYEKISYIYSIFCNELNSLKKKSFVVAVSGGPDSLALAALAKAYNFKNKLKIYYVLVDHSLRKNSSKEAISVKKLLKKYKINLNILKNKKLINKNIQSQAREARYDLITSFCKKKKIKVILTAHNLEDQVETFFIRLSRGSGLHGLSSMKQTSKINSNIYLSRPLLQFKKKQLIEITNIVFRKYFKDPTNKNTKYLRTKIRNLRNAIEKSGINYNQIFKSIENLASSRDTLNFYFNKIYKETSIVKKNSITISLKNYKTLNREMKMRFFQKSIKDITEKYYTVRAKKILYLIDNIKANNNFTLGGCNILIGNSHIMFKKGEKI